MPFPRHWMTPVSRNREKLVQLVLHVTGHGTQKIAAYRRALSIVIEVVSRYRISHYSSSNSAINYPTPDVFYRRADTWFFNNEQMTIYISSWMSINVTKHPEAILGDRSMLYVYRNLQVRATSYQASHITNRSITVLLITINISAFELCLFRLHSRRSCSR